MPTLYSGKAGAVELTVGVGQTTCAMSTKCHVSYAAVIGSSKCVRYRTSIVGNVGTTVLHFDPRSQDSAAEGLKIKLHAYISKCA